MKHQIIRAIRTLLRRLTPERARPGPYLATKVNRVTGGQIYAGPFKGMWYTDRAYCSALLPKLLGVYEQELHTVIERACVLPADRVIDVGCAEGYYAVGFARRRPGVPVVAFELDDKARTLAENVARLNRVNQQISFRGRCGPAELAELTRDGVSLVVCDCEGNEAQLLDPVAVPGLAQSYMLVETHEFVVRGITDDLRQRFAGSHRIELIAQKDRRREDFPFNDLYIRRMQVLDLLGAMSEGRPERMAWLWMEPLRRVG